MPTRRDILKYTAATGVVAPARRPRVESLGVRGEGMLDRSAVFVWGECRRRGGGGQSTEHSARRAGAGDEALRLREPSEH